ncbi:hypothetical protein RB213_012067 [Colletotrichum asianum]
MTPAHRSHPQSKFRCFIPHYIRALLPQTTTYDARQSRPAPSASHISLPTHVGQ